MKRHLSPLIVIAGMLASGLTINAATVCTAENGPVASLVTERAGLPPLSKAEIGRVHELASKVEPRLRAEFERLHAEWYQAAAESPEISLSSSVGSRTVLPQFAAIVKLGSAVMPLVVEQMLDPDRFFTLTVYESLSGATPSQEPDCRKRAQGYVRSWLATNQF